MLQLCAAAAAAFALLGAPAAAEAAEEPPAVVGGPCPNVFGTYLDDNNATVTITPAFDGTAFKVMKESIAGSGGTLFANCLGTYGPSKFFKFEGDVIEFSDGKLWMKQSEGEHSGGEPEGGGDHGLEEDEGNMQVTVTVAIMLFFMLAIVVGLLYLVNCSDTDIQANSYRMVSDTMSVFCAVLLNQSLFSFFVEQLIEGKHPRILGVRDHRINGAFGCFVFVAFWAITVYMCWAARKADFEQQRLYATSHLGGHCIAFAGIYSATQFLHAGHLGRSGTYGLTAMTIFGAIALLTVVWIVSARIVRGKRLRGKHVLEAIEEGQIDAIVLTMSFIVNQLICQWALDGRLPHLHGKQSDIRWRDVRYMTCVALGFLVVYGFTIIAKKRYGNSGSGQEQKEPKDILLSIVEQWLAMSMSWCVQWGSLWSMQLLFSSVHEVTAELTHVINAFFVSFMCVLMIVVVDKIADRLEDPQGQKDARRTILKVDRAITGPLHDGGKVVKHAATTSDLEGISPTSSVTATAFHHLEQMGLKQVENAEVGSGLRGVIVAIGLLVALSWDKAFDAAMETVVEGMSMASEQGGLGSHEVVYKCALGLMMLAFVLPAWYWYIVPQAMPKGGEDEEHTARDPEQDDEEDSSESSEEESGE